MIKLINILNEVIMESKIIQVPQSEIDKAEKLYNYIKDNLEDLESKSPKDWSKAYIPKEYKNYFNIKPIKGNNVVINVAFYNNDKINAAGNADTSTNTDVRIDIKKKSVLINLAYFKNMSSSFFEGLIEHELIHAIDPKTERGKLVAAAFKKNPTAFSAEDLEAYHQQPHEFDAESGAMLAKAKRNLDKSFKDDKEANKAYMNLFLRLINDLKTKKPEDIYSGDQYSQYIRFLLSADEGEYWDAINWIADWVKDPKLYKQFRSRIVSTLT
jgi:hypothetical protein